MSRSWIFAASLGWTISLWHLTAQEPVFRSTAPVVLVPVTVMDAKGRFVAGLRAEDFRVRDNAEQQKLQLDTADVMQHPIALVVAVQANDTAAPALLKIKKVSSLIDTLITGERGQAAVLAVSDKARLVQGFTADGQQIQEAFQNLKPGQAREARLLDAVSQGLTLLRQRPAQERRVLLLISESRDRGSETALEDAIHAAQREGVMIFSLTYSAYATSFSERYVNPRVTRWAVVSAGVSTDPAARQTVGCW